MGLLLLGFRRRMLMKLYSLMRRSDHSRVEFMVRCSSLGWFLLLGVLTAALLLLPLVLPPLPPPPLMLLFVPVAIMAVLLFLAFSPSDLSNIVVSTV